jgi:hypothetical protein
MIGLVVGAIAYLRAYIVSRHRLGLEAAALLQQLVVFKRKHSRPFTAQPRPTLLGSPPVVVERLGRCLIRRMKMDNPGWGAPRIHGELLRLGFDISEPTVSRYLRGLKRPIDRDICREMLDHVIPLNEAHLIRLSQEYIRYYTRTARTSR